MQQWEAAITAPINDRIGQRLRARRRLKGLRAEDLAALMAVSPATIRAWERGAVEMGSADLWVICEHLEMPVSALFAEADEGTEASTSTEGAALAQAHDRLDPAGRRALRALLQDLADSPEV